MFYNHRKCLQNCSNAADCGNCSDVLCNFALLTEKKYLQHLQQKVKLLIRGSTIMSTFHSNTYIKLFIYVTDLRKRGEEMEEPGTTERNRERWN